jgi:transposase
VSVEQLIAEDHPARAVWEFVGRLDLARYAEHVRSVEGSAGRPALDPQLLVSLRIYSYSCGVSSARAIERLCEHDRAYQWLTGMERVSAHTLADFRVERRLGDLFCQSRPSSRLLGAEVEAQKRGRTRFRVGARCRADASRGRHRVTGRFAERTDTGRSPRP